MTFRDQWLKAAEQYRRGFSSVAIGEISPLTLEEVEKWFYCGAASMANLLTQMIMNNPAESGEKTLELFDEVTNRVRQWADRAKKPPIQ